MAAVRARRSTSIAPSCASALPVAALTAAVVHLRVKATVIPPPEVAVVIAIPPRIAAAVAAATDPAAATEADTVKLT
jgi:hypothetical protein